jgi:hypothetical protein
MLKLLTVPPPLAGFVGEVATAVLWAVAELQRQPAGTLWHTYTRSLGKDLLALSNTIVGLQEWLSTEPGYVQLMLPSAQLAWLLLQYEQQAAEAAGGSSSGGSAGARHSARSSAATQQQQQQQRLRLMPGMPGAVLKFTHAFGIALYTGLPRTLSPAADQLCSSDEVVQLLLLFTALSVGAAHKRVAAAANKDRRSSSSSSKRSSSRSGTAAASAAPAAADVPASHLELLAALSPPMRKQVSSQYKDTLRAEDYGSFNTDTVTGAERQADLVLNGLLVVLRWRQQLLNGVSPAAEIAEALAGGSSSSNGSGGNASNRTALLAARTTVVLHEQQLLPPLVQTLAEYMLLLPAPSHGVVPHAMQVIAAIIESAGTWQERAHTQLAASSTDTAAAAAAAALAAGPALSGRALADGLAAPVLLQLGPVVLQYLGGAAAAAATAAAATEQAMLGTSSAVDAEMVTGVSNSICMMLLMVLEQSKHRICLHLLTLHQLAQPAEFRHAAAMTRCHPGFDSR